jgi:sarcosine oxidase subunit beta
MASTVIIGAGVLGASAAFHLARRGLRDVVVIDRADGLGRGATGRALGVFLSQHSHPADIQLSLLARDRLLAFRADTGADPGYRTVGCLRPAETPAELDALRADLRAQQAAGLIEAMELGDERIGWLHPALDRSNVCGAVFCPTDGTVHPSPILRGYAEAAMRLGVRFMWNVDAHELERAPDGLVRAVRTNQGAMDADRVVNAAGPWAGALGHSCGLAMPVAPLCRHVAVTLPTGAISASAPVTVFASDGLQIVAKDGRVALSSRGPATGAAPRGPAVDESWLAAVIATARARMPALADVRIDRAASWTGLEPTTPDGLAVLGAHPDAPNYFVVCGGSATGVMHAPALGHLLAELVVDGRASTLDVTPLAPSRFV